MSQSEPSWGVRINAYEWPRRTDTPKWAHRAQRDKWQEPGLILWDHTQQLVTHLDAAYALDLLDHLRTETAWRQAGLVVGTPAHEIRLDDPAVDAQWILVDKVSLDPDQCRGLLDVLTDHERILGEMKERDAKDLRWRLSAVYERLLDLPPRDQAVTM